MWWTVHYHCKYCKIDEDVWGADDKKLMSMFGLTECPSHYKEGYSVFTRNAEYTLKELKENYIKALK